MSHSNTSPSSEPRERYSWISLPESDTLSGITQHEHAEQGDGVDRTRRPETRAQEQREHTDSSPHAAQENETLLSSRASTALSGAIDDHSLDEPQTRNFDDTHERECNAEYPKLLCPTSSDELKAKFQDQSLRTSTDWVPYTLRRPYLITLSLASLILSTVLAALSWHSYKNHGLGDEDGSTGLLIGWRYTPTIVAIFFTQAVVQVAEDVKRTEAYARMAGPESIEAKFTLFYLPKVWWKSIFVGFSRKRSGGHRRWNLALSSLAAGISVLSISTFSSSVFVAKEILYEEDVQLQRYAAGQTIGEDLSPIQLSPRRDTYLRTISGYLFNVSTSIWSSNSQVIVPFGASNGDKRHATLPNGIWQADTEVFHLNYSCTSMALVEKDIIDITYKYTDIPITSCPNDTCTVSSKGFKVRSEDGCEVQIQGPIAQWDALGAELNSDGFISDTFTDDGGLLWTNMSSNYVSWETLIRDYGQPPAIRSIGEKVLEQWSRTFIYGFSDQCIGRDLLLVSPQWIVRPSPVDVPVGVWEKESWDNLTIRAQVCTPEYHTASLPVSASIDGAETSMSFDVSEFERRRQPVSKQAIDFDLLDDLTFRSDSWDKSSYWIWAAAKSASRKHWMLCLITTGTTLTQILIISMAAVFERQTALISRETWDPSHIDTLWVTAPFELLQEPIDFSNPGERTRNFDLDEHMLDSSNIQWLNHALDEILLEAPQLAWTKDEWTFTPLDMQELPNVTVSSKSRSGSGRHTSSNSIASPANASFITSAIRSRLECSPIAVPDSGWLDQAADVFPNRTNEALQGFALPTTLFDGESYNTSVFSARRRLSCCANGTDPGQQAVVAYWSSNSSMIERVDPNFFIQECTYEQLTNGNCTSANAPSDSLSEDGPEDVIVQGSWCRNFTIKWIVGPGVTAKISGANPAANPKVQQISAPYGSADEELLYFTEEPKMAIMDCIMVIENTSASVTVARSSGNVLDYSLVADPQPALDAWDYAWDILYPSPTSYTGRGNVSYGHLFMTQLLTAPHIITPHIAHSWLSYNRSIEETASERFNIRDRDRGLNVDFMSYANWNLANKDTESLLNATTLLRHSEKTLQIFFKHFVNSGSSSLSGRWSSSGPERAAYQRASSQPVNGTFTKRVEVLAMNETATWLSLTILILLIVILVVLIVSLQIVYPSSCMQHRVECLADALAMVAGSEGLIGLIEEQGVEGFAKSGRLTKLGWFRDARGDVRWGVELVDAEGVEWVDGPEKVVSTGHDEESSIQSGEVVDANSALLESERRSPSLRHSVQEQQTEPMLEPSDVANNASRL
ncbi:uncharacterized protein J4E78_000488 [Alternaria triticimaculans]|uniref:uncharacterized protein n=1 Tax=Alternaria triticimaculans TaxID=297637 RepID=UPI0020C3B63D|nr:uncharacterized protein J4E78_000488 [Alternaria triticimaculans]KAI4671989.1 hypothetical protein J4E78_000488 [Alternaria triticimaculans]